MGKAGFHWATERLKNTAGPFDHVLARGLCPGGSGAAGVAKDETGASDHEPVRTVPAPCPDRATSR
jgi:hypothetical protein